MSFFFHRMSISLEDCYTTLVVLGDVQRLISNFGTASLRVSHTCHWHASYHSQEMPLQWIIKWDMRNGGCKNQSTIHHWHTGVSINGGPKNRWFIEKIPLKWMIGGTPVSGNPHMDDPLKVGTSYQREVQLCMNIINSPSVPDIVRLDLLSKTIDSVSWWISV